MFGKRGKQNQINKESTYINERLPKEQLQIEKHGLVNGSLQPLSIAT